MLIKVGSIDERGRKEVLAQVCIIKISANHVDVIRTSGE